MSEGLITSELAALLGLTQRQVRYTSSRVHAAIVGRPYSNWVWTPDEVRRWQCAVNLWRGRTGLEVSKRTDQTSLVSALRAVYKGPPPDPTALWLAYSGGAVSYVDSPEDIIWSESSVLLVQMPTLWPTTEGEAHAS